MIKVLWNTGRIRRIMARLQAIEEYADEAGRWRRDPLAHPAIMAMNERERADLPFRSVREGPEDAPYSAAMRSARKPPD